MRKTKTLAKVQVNNYAKSKSKKEMANKSEAVKQSVKRASRQGSVSSLTKPRTQNNCIKASRVNFNDSAISLSFHGDMPDNALEVNTSPDIGVKPNCHCHILDVRHPPDDYGGNRDAWSLTLNGKGRANQSRKPKQKRAVVSKTKLVRTTQTS